MLNLRWREDDAVRLAWDFLYACIAIITVLLLPLELLHRLYDHQNLSPLWLVFALLGMVDIWLNFNTCYERDGFVIKSPRLIARSYLRGMAPIDLLSNLPVLLVPAVATGATPFALLPCLRIVRFLFLARRWEYLNLGDIRLLRIVRYGFGIGIVTHWMACLWLWVGLVQAGSDGWIIREDLLHTSFSNLYETSLFWAVTLVTVGYGEILPHTPLEIRVAMLMMASSLLIYTFAIANMLTILNELDGGRSAYNEHQAMLGRFLAFNGVSDATINRVRRFNDYQWARTRGFRTAELFEGLPAELRSEITVEMMHDALGSVPLLALSPASLQKRLLAVLEPVTYPPGTVVLEADEPGERIVFITRGSVSIDSPVPLPDEVCSVGAGDYIGDLSFFLHERRHCRVIAETYVVAFLLSRTVFESLRHDEPNLQSVLKRIASEQSSRNQALLLAGVVV